MTFAAEFGFTTEQIRNWEQGRRKPEGSARVLLWVVERHPEAVFETVGGALESAQNLALQEVSAVSRRVARH